MARPKPAPEDAPDRRTVSLRSKVALAADNYRQHPNHAAEGIRDFSDLTERALSEFLERHHPGLIAEVVASFRRAPALMIAAEEAGKYMVSRKAGPPPGYTEAKAQPPRSAQKRRRESSH